eukprot:gnl/TRDRNA2_/TRDRNA2_34252_c0_seq1.p1 gnl/TRDRNA2_/TRDRNA2_34252_c0~~gnl/TRDRNA2_/TRDRNA2_34252_c0_seq1.p1  ORF type:complete len:413 (+),score=13.90 gnl/TRDRNA2_/TRDRNA2_34252_c0_seq1:59-1297(+)
MHVRLLLLGSAVVSGSQEDGNSSLQCIQLLQDARRAYHHNGYHAHMRPLGDVCAFLPKSFSEESILRIRDFSRTGHQLIEVEEALEDPRGLCLLVLKGETCRVPCCIPVDRTHGCITGNTVAALTMLLLHLGAKVVRYSHMSNTFGPPIAKPCDPNDSVEGLMAVRGSEPVLHKWLDGAGPSATAGECQGKRVHSRPSTFMIARGLDKGLDHLLPFRMPWGNVNKGHEYTRLYDLLFPPLRRCTMSAVLEVGLGHIDLLGIRSGSSLRAWRDIFPLANVTGLDINSTYVAAAQGSRLHTHVCDTQNSTLVQRTLGSASFDLIVDDGLHTPFAQRATMKALWPHLRYGGLYVVEDLDSPRDAFLLALALDHGIAVCTRSPLYDWLVVSTRTSSRRPLPANRDFLAGLVLSSTM